jgi:hypothetical protein
MLQKVSVRYFKTIVNVPVELGQLNVLIGPNGSEKANLLSRDTVIDMIMLHLLFTSMLFLHLWTPPLVGVENISDILDAPLVCGLAGCVQLIVLSGSGSWQVLWATQRGEVLCAASRGLLQESGQVGSYPFDQLAACDALRAVALLPERYISVLSAVARVKLVRDYAREHGMKEGTAWSWLPPARAALVELLAGCGWRRP